MEKRKVTISIGGQLCSFYSDDPDEYISVLEQRANDAMKQTAKFSGISAYTNAILTVLSLTDKTLRMEEKEEPQRIEHADKPQGTEQRESKKSNTKAGAKDKGQVSVWDLLEEQMM